MPALNLDYRTTTRSFDWKKLEGISDPRDVLSAHDWVYNTPSDNWLDGVPLGNGDMAAMLYGSPNRITWVLNKSDVWDHRVPGNDSNLPNVSFKQIANWVADGDWKALTKLEDRGKNLTPRHYLALQPTAWVVLESIGESTFTNFKQVHSLLTGEVVTEFDTDFMANPFKLTHYSVQSFLAADQNVLRIRIEAERPLRNVRARLVRPHFPHLPDPIFKHRGTLLQLQYTFPDNLLYVVGLESDIPSRLASQDSNESTIVFDDVEDNFLELRVVVACSETTKSPEDRVRATLNVEKPQRYRGAIRRNYQAMEKFWTRSGMQWPDNPLLEKYWYLGQYLLGACAAVGKQAAGLQGLWNGHGFPAWHGSYRTDLHLQMNHWGIFSSNRLDLGEPYVRLLALETRDQMRTDTARVWGWGGIKVPLCFGPKGQEISTWLPAKLWPGGTAWVAVDFLKFWEYSSDVMYLTTIAYPFARECAEFLENWLFQGGGDYVEIFPSFCPNLGKGSNDVWAENPTCDIALYRCLFEKLIKIAGHPEIREEQSRIDRWQFILDRLPDYPIQNGQFADARNVDWKESHRYLAKLMMVYPLNLISTNSPKSDVQTALDTLRGLEEMGSEKMVGFTQIWMAGIATRLGLGSKAITRLEHFIGDYLRVNGINRHCMKDASYSQNTIQIDANLGFVGVVNELFLQVTDGIMRIFPGLGKKATASFWGWRAEGGFLVAARINKGKVDGLLIEATRTGTLSLQSPFVPQKLSYKLRYKTRLEKKTISNRRNKVLEFDLKAGQRIEFGRMLADSTRKKSVNDSADTDMEDDSDME